MKGLFVEIDKEMHWAASMAAYKTEQGIEQVFLVDSWRNPQAEIDLFEVTFRLIFKDEEQQKKFNKLRYFKITLESLE